jgi:hypothetical protein
MRAAEIAVRVAMAGAMALLAACAAPPLALDGVDLFGGKRGVDPSERALEQRPQAWMLFGRLGVINYQNQLGRDDGSGGQITLRRSGPGIGGTRIYVGIRRRF